MDDDAGGSKRLRIIVGLGVAALMAGLAIGIVGNQRVTEEVSRVRARATSAVIDPSDIVMSGFDASSDPIADALGVQPRSIVQTDDLGWCAWIEVSHLASSRSLYFEIDSERTVVEVQRC